MVRAGHAKQPVQQGRCGTGVGEAARALQSCTGMRWNREEREAREDANEVISMKADVVVAFGFSVLGGVAVLAQAPYTPAHLQAPRDPGYAALIATCKTPPPPAAPRGGGAPGARPGGAAPAAGAQPGGRAGGAPAGPADYTVAEIPGVIAAGQRWKLE